MSKILALKSFFLFFQCFFHFIRVNYCIWPSPYYNILHFIINIYNWYLTLISETKWCPKDWTNEGGTYLKSVYIPMKRFNSKPPQKRMALAKLKCSTYLPHIFSTCFFRFSLNFPNVKHSNCFHHRSTDVCKHTGKGKTFYSNEFFLCKNTWIGCTASASTIHGFGCVAHKRIYSQWLQRYMMPSVFLVATPKRNATATRKEPLCWDGFYSESLKQTVDQLWEHCASWFYTRRGRKLIL